MYGPSWLCAELLCAEFVMGRVCHMPSLLCAELSLNQWSVFGRGPPGFNCWISVAPALVLSTHQSCFISVFETWFIWLICLLFPYIDELARSPSRGLNNLYVHEPQQNRGRGCVHVKPVLATHRDFLLSDRFEAVLLLRIIIIVNSAKSDTCLRQWVYNAPPPHSRRGVGTCCFWCGSRRRSVLSALYLLNQCVDLTKHA